MATLFNPQEARKRLLEWRFQFEEDQKKENSPVSYGNVASYMVSTVIESWLVGLWDESQPVLEKAILWLDEAIEQKVQFSYSPDNHLARLYRTRGLARWMWMQDNLGYEDRDNNYGMAIWYRERAWDNKWHQDGRPASRRDALEQGMDEYLLDCIQAYQPKKGRETYENFGGKLTVTHTNIRSTRDCAYLYCRQLDEYGEYGELEIQDIKAGEKLLKKNMESNWLRMGGYLEMAVWLKVIYSETGQIEKPCDVILKAYDFMPNVKPLAGLLS